MVFAVVIKNRLLTAMATNSRGNENDYQTALEMIGKCEQLTVNKNEELYSIVLVSKILVFLAAGENDEKVRECYESCHAIRERVCGPYHPLTCESMHNLGIMHERNGNLEKALECFEEAAKRRSKRPHSEAYAESIHCAATCRHKMGNFKQAMREYEKCALLRKNLGENLEYAG